MTAMTQALSTALLQFVWQGMAVAIIPSGLGASPAHRAGHQWAEQSRGMGVAARLAGRARHGRHSASYPTDRAYGRRNRDVFSLVNHEHGRRGTIA